MEQLWQCDRRYTEWAAVYLMVKKMIPGWALPSLSPFAAPPKAHRSHDTDGLTLEEVLQKKHIYDKRSIAFFHHDHLKRCKKCRGAYPATTDYFHVLVSGRDGLHPQCKWCRGKK